MLFESRVLRVFWWLWGFQGSRQNFGASGILPKTTLVVPADSVG